MKKSYLLLPLVAAMTLAGCSSNNAEVAEPSVGPATATPLPSWQSEGIQSVDMPASMSSAPTQTMGQSSLPTPTAASLPTPAAQPSYTPAPAPKAKSEVSQPKAVSTTTSSHTSTQCEVVRDNTGTPVYAQMTKGCYTDSHYTVGKSDTIYLISFLTGKTPAQIASLNNMTTNSKLTVGQVLRVR